MKAAFLDRDGIINSNANSYYVYQEIDLVYNPDIVESLQTLVKNGFQLFIFSNQGGVSKGEYTREQVELLHKKMEMYFAEHNVHFVEIVFCPHHHSVEQCFCRKPKTIMLEKLVAKYKIDITQSIVIGDSQRDIDAGETLGIRSYLLPANNSILQFCHQLK